MSYALCSKSTSICLILKSVPFLNLPFSNLPYSASFSNLPLHLIVQMVGIKQILKITPSTHQFLLHLNFHKLYQLYQPFELRNLPTPSQSHANLLVVRLPTSTYFYLHLPTSWYIYLHLHTSTHIYLHLSKSTYFYLLLPSSTYIYLHLPTSTYIYLHRPTST